MPAAPNFIEPEFLPLPEPPPPVRDLKVYAHNDKDSNWNTWQEQLGQPENEAGRAFSYTAYEVEFDCTVDVRTGKVTCHKVNGVPLITDMELN